MYYRERQVAQSLGCTWVLGNPGILRKGGGGVHVSQSWDLSGMYILGCLNPGMNLGTRESQRYSDKGRINILGSAWDVLGTLVLYYVTWDSIVLYERVLAFLDMSGRNAYIFIARGV